MILSIEITSYKPSGKWYSSCKITKGFEKPIHIHSDEFIQLVYENATLVTDGYIVISDMNGGEGFHNRLFTTDKLKRLYIESMENSYTDIN